MRFVKQLQYYKEKQKSITATAPPVLQKEKGTAILTTVAILQRERERNCNYYNHSSIATQDTVIIATLPGLQKKRNCNYILRPWG